MAAKEVAPALGVLTSDGFFERCQEWSDNSGIEVLICDYFSRSGYNQESEESSDNEHIGMPLIFMQLLQY